MIPDRQRIVCGKCSGFRYTDNCHHLDKFNKWVNGKPVRLDTDPFEGVQTYSDT